MSAISPAGPIRLGGLATLAAAVALAVGCGERPVDDAPSARLVSPAGRARVRVLGTVQDGGLPHAACDCPRCAAASADPARRRRVASLALLLADGRALLIDATPDLREQLRSLGRLGHDGVDRRPVDGVLLTHAHIGHYLGLAFFGFEAVHTSGLAVWASPPMADFLRANGPWSQLVELGNVDLREVRPGESLELGGGVSVTALAVPHRDEYADTLGFRFQGPAASLLYVPDTDSWEAWERPLVEIVEGVDVAILDGTFYSSDELPGRDVASIGHPLITRTVELLAPLVEAGRLEVHFTHLNHSNPALDPASPERAALERRGFRVLEEGREFPL